jgi:hypothetical protein
MKYNHSENCTAAICAGDTNKDYKKEIVWCAGEKVCNRKPFLKFQKKQLDINKEIKKGTFRNIDKAYTANELEACSI